MLLKLNNCLLSKGGKKEGANKYFYKAEKQKCHKILKGSHSLRNYAYYIRNFRFYSKRVWKVLSKSERKAAFVFIENVI